MKRLTDRILRASLLAVHRHGRDDEIITVKVKRVRKTKFARLAASGNAFLLQGTDVVSVLIGRDAPLIKRELLQDLRAKTEYG